MRHIWKRDWQWWWQWSDSRGDVHGPFRTHAELVGEYEKYTAELESTVAHLRTQLPTTAGHGIPRIAALEARAV